MNEQEEVFVPKKRKNNNNRKNRRKNKSVRINDINVVEVYNKKETINDKKIKNSIEKTEINDFQIVDVKKDAIEEKVNNNINDLMTKENMQESKEAKEKKEEQEEIKIIDNNEEVFNTDIIPTDNLVQEEKEEVEVFEVQVNNQEEKVEKEEVKEKVPDKPVVNVVTKNNVTLEQKPVDNNINKNEEIIQRPVIPTPALQQQVVDNNVSKKETRKKEKKSSGLIGILSNGKVVTTIMILAFISVCLVVIKTFYYGKKVNEYEDLMLTIDKKIEEDTKIYASQELDNELLKKVAASELTSCINTKLDTDKLPDSIKKAIQDIKDYYNQSNNHFAFVYKDIYTGFTVSYNENQTIFAASTIKAPTDIYIYEMASLGKIDLDKELTYTPAQYVVGSGNIQYAEMYTKYKTRDLLRYSTVISDNVAHNILIDNYGRVNMLNFWSKLGTTSIFKLANNWGNVNAHDAMVYMSELYRFYNENEEYGNALMTNFLNATPKFIKGKNGYKVANKSGWRGSVVHDASIIFADNPYIIVALSNMGNENYGNYFNKANDLAYKLHTEYWKYKMEVCKDIKQY